MDKYVAIECRLAEALGYKNICVKMSAGVQTISTIVDGKFVELPKWARDNAAAFELMVEHEVALEYYGDQVCAVLVDMQSIHGICICKYENYPDKQAAIRFAIISAVIDKLEAK